MLAVKLHIPRNCVNLMRFVIDHIKLDQSLNSCLVDVLKPDVFAEV